MDRLKREQLSIKLSDCADAVLMEEDDARIGQLLERTFREAMDEFELVPPRGPALAGRQGGRRRGGAVEAAVEAAVERYEVAPPVEETFPPFDEPANRKAVVGFLDAMVMSVGTVGRHTASRLASRTFGTGAGSAQHWLVTEGLVGRAEDGALQITDEGRAYLDKHRDRARSYGARR